MSDHFMSWAKKVMENLSILAGDDVKNSILEKVGIPENLKTKEEQDKWIKDLLEMMSFMFDEKRIAEILEGCGRSCLMPMIKDMALDIWNNTNEIDSFIQAMNERHIGGGFLSYQNGIIYGKYSQCYCPIAGNTSLKLPGAYCNCSRGWLKELFEHIFNKKVDVEVTESIIRGDNACVFKVDLNCG